MEFDEEDEDFWEVGLALCWTRQYPLPKQREGSSASRGTSRDDGVSVDSSLSASSASVNMDNDAVGTVDGDIWQGWDYQDKMVIKEAEHFDDISAVVFFWIQNRLRRSPLLLRMVRVRSGMAGKDGSIDRYKYNCVDFGRMLFL